jgi:hypothetical protein
MTPSILDLSILWDSELFQPQPALDSEMLNHWGFIPGLKDLLMLRQVHALEHATVWVLSEKGHSTIANSKNKASSQPDNETLGGLSTEKGFYLYGDVNRLDIQRAVRQALHRCQQGEWQLAVHPRCGTNVSVNLILTAALTLGAHLILPRSPMEQLIGIGIAATTAAQISPDMGLSVQKYLTTAIPFNLELVDIKPSQDFWQRSGHFVEVRWQDLQ